MWFIYSLNPSASNKREQMTPAQRIREALERTARMFINYDSGVAIKVNELREANTDALSALDTIEEESRWIPVGERLPEEGERVLLTDENGDIEIAIRRDHYGRRVWADSADDDYSWWMMEAWTHWMPLPPPPKV